MKIKYVDKEMAYDGTQLSSLFAFKNFSLQGDSIVAFVGPCHVALEKMVDLLDVLNEDAIYSKRMLHFIAEHFEMDLEKTIMRQRLLITVIKETIEKLSQQNLERKGDDLFLGDKKLSVSIATLSPVSTIIHTGLNLDSHDTPVLTVSLPELGIVDHEAFACQVLQNYQRELDSIKMARCKVRGVP